ncbi:MAG: diguanylate cyclase [Acidimicrobiales bacterium]|nr:diguanylate cyclase [Acidimicrobiales bacterium]
MTPELAAHLLGAAPLAMAVIDPGGRVLWASERAARLVGRTPGQLVSMPITELLHPEDASEFAESFEFALGVRTTIMGPIRYRYIHPVTGAETRVDAWVDNRTNDPDIGGFVVQFTEEAARDRLTEAISAIAAHRPLPEVLAHAARSLEGHPVVAAAGILRTDDQREIYGTSSLKAALFGGDASSGPWDEALLTGEPVVVSERSALPAELADLAAHHGLHAAWCWPIPGDQPGCVVGALTAWRGRPGTPSPNQRAQLERAAAVAGLAMARNRQLELLEQAARLDPLTGLANRSVLDTLRSEVDRAEQALLYIDLDRFKAVNDEHGHVAGDDVLCAAAERLRNCVRAEDHIARIGGDEFVVVCAAPCSNTEVQAMADRILSAFAEPIRLADGTTVCLGVSIGIAHKSHGSDFDGLLRHADRALLRAKAGGRGQWQVASN